MIVSAAAAGALAFSPGWPDTPSTGNRMRRPTSFVVLAFGFAWLTFSALGNLVTVAVAPRVIEGMGFRPAILIGSALAVAVTAGMVTVGLWRVAHWVVPAIAAWALACDLGAIAFTYMVMQADMKPPMPTALFFLGVLIFLLLPWLLVGFVADRSRRAHARFASTQWQARPDRVNPASLSDS